VTPPLAYPFFVVGGNVLSTIKPGTANVSQERWQTRHSSDRDELGPVDLFLFQLKKDWSEPRILRHHFRQAAADPAERHGVVKENSPWILRIDLVRLKARWREDGDLRFLGKLERLQNGGQIALVLVEREPDRAGPECGD
jgi:hypothetical protein